MANNYVSKSVHTSSYWQEVARTMEAVNDGKPPVVPVAPQADPQKPAKLNDPKNP
ncbi:hypothetical protein MF451_003816 [Salmonella enterica subsp. enterica serovar Saintpaul]|nr:hypothetical protein [Salmonella enterica subsp. enterica serovar Saintpaul]